MTMEYVWSAIAILMMLAVGAVVYFLPMMVAIGRRHHQVGAIIILNLLLGWTLLGWIGALVWAATQVRRRKQDEWD